MTEIRTNLAKRLTYLSASIAALWTISILAMLDSIGARQQHLELASLKTLTAFNGIYDRESAAYGNAGKPGRRWLAQHHNALYKNSLGVRQTIHHWLKGLDDAICATYETQRDQYAERFSAIAVPLSDEEIALIAPKPPPRWMRFNETKETETLTVNTLIARFRALFEPRTVIIATQICQDNSPSMPHRKTPESQYPQLAAYFIETGSKSSTGSGGNNLILRFQMGTAAAGQGVAPIYEDIAVAIKQSKLHAVSLAQMQGVASSQLEDIFTGGNSLERLTLYYGDLPVETATELASARAIASLQKISAMGFTFPRRQFPIAVLVLMSLFVTGIFLTMKKGMRLSLDLAPGVWSDSAFEMLIDTGWLRAFVWIVLPFLAVVLSHPPFWLSISEYVFLAVGGALLLAMGIQVCRRLSARQSAQGGGDVVRGGGGGVAHRRERVLRRKRRIAVRNLLISLVLLAAMGCAIVFAVREAQRRRVAEVASEAAKEELAVAVEREALANEAREAETIDNLDAMSGVGDLLKSMSKYEAAMPYYRRALEGYRRVFGSDHADTLMSVNNIGFLLHSMGKNEEALESYREELECRRRVQGDGHPDTLGSIHNMGFLLQAIGRIEEAMPYCLEAMEGRRSLLGDNHPDTLDSISCMGTVHALMGNNEEAMVYLQEALDGKRRVLGDHASTLISIYNMAHLLHSTGRKVEAIVYYREELECRRRVQGEDHPDVADSLNNLASLFQSMGQYDDAEPLFKQALDIGRTAHSGRHPDLAASLNNYGEALAHLGKPHDAISHFKESIEIYSHLVEKQGRTELADKLSAVQQNLRLARQAQNQQ